MASTSFRLNGTSASVDETGLTTISIPYYVATEAEAARIGSGEEQSPLGLREIGRSWQDADEGLKGFMVKVDYEGITTGDNEEEPKPSFEFDPSFSEEPIESHPNFLEIKDKYGGSVDDKGKVVWPQYTTPDFTEPHSVGFDDDDLEGIKNPLFGVKTYLSLKSVFRKTYTVKILPKDLLDSIGSITESLPDDFPTPEGRNWLKMPPKVTQRGNGYQISEELLLSQAGGKWPEEVHSLIEI